MLIEQYPCRKRRPGKYTGDVPKSLRYDVGVLPRYLRDNIDGSLKSVNGVEDIKNEDVQNEDPLPCGIGFLV